MNVDALILSTNVDSLRRLAVAEIDIDGWQKDGATLRGTRREAGLSQRASPRVLASIGPGLLALKAVIAIKGDRGRELDVVVAHDCQLLGDAAAEIQHLYLTGKKAEAAAAIPDELAHGVALVGAPGQVAERVAAFAQAGVATLNATPMARPTSASSRTWRS